MKIGIVLSPLAETIVPLREHVTSAFEPLPDLEQPLVDVLPDRCPTHFIVGGDLRDGLALKKIGNEDCARLRREQVDPSPQSTAELGVEQRAFGVLPG
jgi:hypothetical protein